MYTLYIKRGKEIYKLDNVIFPAGLVIDLTGINSEMMALYSKKWNLELIQLEKGSLNINLLAAHTPRIQLAKAEHSHGILTKGDFPKGCIVLNSYFTSDGVYNVNNELISPNEIIILREGDEIDRITSGHFGGHIISIEEQLFNKSFLTFFGDTPDLHFKNNRFIIKEDMIIIFHQAISMWIDYLVNKLPKLAVEPDYSTIESQILNQLFCCFEFKPLKIHRKKFHIDTVRDYIHKNIHNPIHLNTLSDEFNISESQLHNAFQSNYGISPMKYLKMLRFNAARKDLLLASPHECSIESIASKYYFMHMNHFSSMYKNIFGELPSQTLNH